MWEITKFHFLLELSASMAAVVFSSDTLITSQEQTDLIDFLTQEESKRYPDLWDRITTRIANKSAEQTKNCKLELEVLILLHTDVYIYFLAEKHLQLVAGLNYAQGMGNCITCASSFKLALGGPIMLGCTTPGCFAHYLCCKNKKIPCFLCIFNEIFLVMCAQKNTFICPTSKCLWCSQPYIGFTAGHLADQSNSIGACAAIILAEYSSKASC